MWGRGLLVAVAIACATTEPALADDSGWMSGKQAMSQANSLKRQGKIITSVSCRNVSKNPGYIKVEVKITSKPNPKNREWALFAYKGQLDYKPGPPAQWNQWRRVSHKVIPSGGTKFHCSLFHHK